MNKKSAGKAQESKAKPAKIHPKTDVRHWKERLIRRSYAKDGKTYHDPFYSVQIQFRGRREAFVLETANKDAAADRARDIFLSLLSAGWTATLAKWKPGTEKKATPEERPSVGVFLTAARAVCHARLVSYQAYSQAMRKIIADIEGLEWKSPTPAELTEWRERVDAVALDTITPDRVEEWKISKLREAGADPTTLRSSKITVNSLIRNARALFSKRMLPLLRSRVTLPSPLPFEGVRLEKKPSMRYASKMDAAAIIKKAMEKLASQDVEAFKVFLLAVCCGLRVSEIDTLLWSSFDFEARKLHVEANAYTSLKSDDSAGEIELDAEIVALFRGYKAKATGEFVIESGGKPRNRNERRGYRIEGVWKRTLLWLRANGVNDPKPIHALRKELGSLVNQQHGIVAAQRVLRHANIATTAGHYVDKKGSVSVGLGKLLNETGNVISFQSAAPVAKEKSSQKVTA
jgi:integrase